MFLFCNIEEKEEDVYIQGLYDDRNGFMRNIKADRKHSGSDNNREPDEQREEETV